MAYYYSCNLVALLALILTFQIHNAASPFATKLSLRLIHHRSILPHYYTNQDDIRAPVMAAEDRTTFMVNISIGEPPVPLLLAMDTGGSFVWVPCTPCDDYCDNIIFDRTKSSTYSVLSRDDPQCSSFVDPSTQRFPSCTYNLTFVDQSSSFGALALEKFTFVTSTDGTTEVSNAVLGCSSTWPLNLQGMLGLGAPSKYHLVARTGNKFSYCIGNITDDQYMYSVLILGDGAIIQGDLTPMGTNEHGQYTVTLEGISIGETQLEINGQHEVVIDSGTTRTYLVKDAYDVLLSEVAELLDGRLDAAAGGENDEEEVCYTGDLERDLKGFPIVTLHLAGGADIDLDAEAVFRRIEDGSTICMAIIESDRNIIGVMAQQFYNVGFDLDEEIISFQRIDCQLLQD